MSGSTGADATVAGWEGSRPRSPKLGIALCPVPPGVDEERATEWRIEHGARLGATVVAGDPRPLYGWDARKYDLGYLTDLRQRADDLGMEIEPYAGAVFDLAGPDAATGRERCLASLRAARILGGPYVRAGYGQSDIATSRFNPDIPVKDHLGMLVESLREAAKLAEQEGVILGVENHLDFTGRELRWVLEEVASARVRAAVDTGNAYAVYSLPEDDIQALAPLAVLCHVKDFKVVKSERGGPLPFIPVACVVGDGQVQIASAVSTLLTQGDRGSEMPLMLEAGWVPPGSRPDRREILELSLGRMPQLLDSDPDVPPATPTPHGTGGL